MRCWVMGMVVLLILWCARSFCAQFCEDFTPAAGERWRLEHKGAGRAEIAQGVLTLDLTSPTIGKAAFADLQRALDLPVTIQWDQQLTADGPHCYWAGVQVWSGSRSKISAGMGGAGAGHRFKLGRTASEVTGRVGEWYTFTLRVEAQAQSLRVTPRGRPGERLAEITAHEDLPKGRCHLSLCQCLDRFEAMTGDGYAQDRGASSFARLRIESDRIDPAEVWPPEPPAPVVFNRRTVWLDEDDGIVEGVISYEEGGDLWVTGSKGASSWFAPRPGRVQDEDESRTLFRHADAKPRTATLRAFQWDVEQHPVLELNASPSNAKWSLVIACTNNYAPRGPVLYASAPASKPLSLRVDLRDLWRRKGFETRHAEVDITLTLEREAGGAEAEISFSARLLPQAAIAVASPVIRTLRQAEEGVPIQAVFLDEKGARRHGKDAGLEASVEGRTFRLEERGDSGVFCAKIAGLPVGVHDVLLTGKDNAAAKARIRVVPGNFVERYSPERRCYVVSDGTALGPLLGDVYSWNPFVHFAEPGEEMVCGFQEYLAKVRSAGLPLQLLKQRALTRRQIETYMEYLARSGVRVIRLVPNPSVYEEFLDAGGALAMRGFEQLEIVLEAAARHHIMALINLFHYPYASPSVGGHPPVSRYYEAGYYGPAGFADPKIQPLLRGYLRQLLTMLRNDDTVLGYSLTGENDQSHGKTWINGMFDFVRSQAPHHLVTQEQGGAIQSCEDRDPWSYDGFKPTKSGGLGYRTYYTQGWKTDCFIGVCARFYNLNRPSFLAEADAGFNPSEDFRTSVRDNVWASFLAQQPLSLMWCSCPFEGERQAPTRLGREIVWSRFTRRRPDVAVRIYRPDDEQLGRMVQYEDAFAGMALDYDYLWGDSPGDGYAAVFDARQAFAAPKVPDAVLKARRLEVTPGSSATLLEDEGSRVLVAYIRNSFEYKTGRTTAGGRGTELHRQRTTPRSMQVTLKNLPGARSYRVWDLDEQRVVKEGAFKGAIRIDLGETASDWAVCVLGR